ncbi:sulfur starvation response protein OscA [Pseudomonas borbori]
MTTPSQHPEPDAASILREIQTALHGLKFGAVEITVHNGQIVQIERKEKFRLQTQSNKAD